MIPSSQPLGSVWACRSCPSKTFGTTEALKHSVETGHETYPVLEVREEPRR